MSATVTRRLVSIAVSTRTVRRYIAEGQLEAVGLGRETLRIKVDSIERFIAPGPSATGGEMVARRDVPCGCGPTRHNSVGNRRR